ncbi:MAG: ribosome silencing factor [Desulfobacterales bacterium]|nr:ribosome silencing factor [Desulfobacterales bacterium]
MSKDTVAALDVFIEAVTKKKALNLVVLDVQNLTSIADAFIICSGKSNRQVNAIADAAIDHLKKHKIKPLSVEGTGEGHWVLLDYGDVVIHIFYEPVREFFDLEGLWVDAKRVETPALKKLQSSKKQV